MFGTQSNRNKRIMRNLHLMVDGVALRRCRLCLSLLGLVSLAACSTATPDNPTLTIRTSPEYATISPLNGGWRSISPATVNFDNPVRDSGTGCFVVSGFRATWLSGAVESTPSRINLCGNYSSYEQVINRPSNAPGLDHDLTFAGQQAAASAAQRQRSFDAWSDAAGVWGKVLGQKLAQ